MKFRTLFIFIAILLTQKFVFAATSLETIENYLNGINSLQGQFEQLSPSGELLRGQFFIQKPGKMRLDYASPSSQLIFTHDGVLYFYDKRTKDLSHTPLEQSLAEFLLRREIKFNRAIKIKKFEEDDRVVLLTLQKEGGEDLGALTLVFQLKPFQLIQWIIVDAQGKRTVVNLYKTKKNEKINFKTDPREIVQR